MTELEICCEKITRDVHGDVQLMNNGCLIIGGWDIHDVHLRCEKISREIYESEGLLVVKIYSFTPRG